MHAINEEKCDTDSDSVNDDDSMFLGFIDTNVNASESEWTELI